MRSEQEIREAIAFLANDHQRHPLFEGPDDICGQIKGLLWVLEEGLLDN